MSATTLPNASSYCLLLPRVGHIERIILYLHGDSGLRSVLALIYMTASLVTNVPFHTTAGKRLSEERDRDL